MIVLYMLSRCDVSLSKSQIYDFMLDEGYTTFMTLQEVFSELVSSGLVTEKTVANRTYLLITDEGEQSLEFFGNRINPAIKIEIDEYLRENSMKLRNEASIISDYRKTGDNEYTAMLTAKENGQNLVDINLIVPTEEIAQSVCNRWQENNSEIYQFLIEKLML